MMRTVLDIIQGCAMVLYLEGDVETGIFTADMDVDCDGSGGNPFHDPYFQPDTSYHFEGKPLHAEVVPYVVIPPIFRLKTKGIVLGCHCEATNLENGRVVSAVVGDVGPTRKVGEGSPELARRLGLDPNPNHGGTSEKIIKYKLYVGQPALVDGICYPLQAA